MRARAGVVALALLAACSGGEASAPTTTTSAPPETTPTTAAATTTTAPRPASDVALPTSVDGPIEGGDRGVPYNPMPDGMAAGAGYIEEEFFVGGDARSFAAAGALSVDGRWAVAPTGTTAPYVTRIIVRRPTDAR